MKGMGQQRRRLTRVRGGSGKGDGSTAQWNRRIYDPRRWHRRSGTASSHANLSAVNGSSGGQPPAGWMLVWAGRFKRWRRRWFVAHPPGLLLYYKTSDQIGRPGCISLLGATVAAVAGKDRQFKIVKGTAVYYLRAINREFRQAWVDTIRESIDTYNKHAQKAQVGVPPDSSVLPHHQSLPPHIGEEWEEQEIELNIRLNARLQELEPARHAFLQQLQTLQRSLSAISGALGLTNQPAIEKSTSSNNVSDISNPRPSQSGGDVSSYECHLKQLSLPEDGNNETVSKSPGAAQTAILPLVAGSREKISYLSIFKPRKVEADNRQKEITSLRTVRSGPPAAAADPSETKNRRRSLSFSMEMALSDHGCLHQQGRSVCADCFNWRKRTESNKLSSKNAGHFSDSEISREPYGGKTARPSLSTIVGSDSDVGCNSIPRDSVDWFTTDLGGGGDQANGKEGPDQVGTSKPASFPGKGSETVANGPNNTDLEHAAYFPTGTSEQNWMKSQGYPDKAGPRTQGPLQAAWNSLMDAFSEVLKEEVHRVLDLEAENAVLQESLAELPELQKDRIALVHLREQLKKDQKYAAGQDQILLEIDGDDGDDEQDGDETEDDDASIVASEVTNEEYFEALEVLNQYEFMAKAKPGEDQEALAEAADVAIEPPEEGDIPADADVLSETEAEEMDQPRTRLPAPRPLNRGFSLWTVLKNAIGKDLNRITMPATINEPLSVLQRSSEEMQYRHLLEMASKQEDSLERLLWVSAFACSTYHGSILRDAKPFNPLLGETYEWMAPDSKAWFLAEQVSHHPPIMAFQCESKHGNFVVYGEIEIRNKFWGKSVEVIPTGLCHLRFLKHGDHFTWNKVVTCVHNVVVGKLWIDNYGELVVRNHTTGEHSRMRFHKATSRERCRISGKVYDSAGVARLSLYGSYMDRLFASPEPATTDSGTKPDSSRCLWKCPEPPEDFLQQYCFTRFTIGLNELTPKLAEVLPPTDSRLRPDQRALEEGDLEKATPEKLRLEEKQREAQRRRKEKAQQWQPLWFRQRLPGVSQVRTINDGEEPSWVYQHKYWENRERRAWKMCPDIM